MKRLILILGLSVMLFSCATDKMLLTDKEMETTPYHTDGFKVMRDSVVVGEVTSTEVEIDPKGRKNIEISITLTGIDKVSESDEIIKFLHTKYPKNKIEINLDGLREFKTE